MKKERNNKLKEACELNRKGNTHVWHIHQSVNKQKSLENGVCVCLCVLV